MLPAAGDGQKDVVAREQAKFHFVLFCRVWRVQRAWRSGLLLSGEVRVRQRFRIFKTMSRIVLYELWAKALAAQKLLASGL